MAKTLLNGVNEVLKRTGNLDSDAGLLTTLTDSARQHWIDVAIQVWNELIDEVYSRAHTPKPNQLSSSTITLATSTRAYAVASDMLRLRTDYHLYDATNGHYIYIVGEDGYREAILSDPEEDDTGLASFAVLRPTDGKLYVNKTPTSAENGRIYTYRYEKDMELTVLTDTFPFTNAVFRALVPAAAEMWKMEIQNSFQEGLFNASVGRAARYLTQMESRDSWLPVRVYGAGSTDPLDG